MKVSQNEAKKLMDSGARVTILDVRTDEEFELGHIPGAMLIPDYELVERAEAELPDKAATILVYCRSGSRSELAAKRLERLGYTDVRDFGGLMDWSYEVE